MSENYYLFFSSFISLFILIAFILCLKIRGRIPKNKICWFCHKSQKVLRNEMNSFNCVECHQYNGFSQDGNYNKVISAQFQRRSALQYCQPISDSFSKSVQLCGECNVRQEIKIKLLSQFIPFNELNFTEECEEYKKYLEKEYKLCSNCETIVARVLSEPINCIKDVVKNNIISKSDTNIDSVFDGQNKRKWISFTMIYLFVNSSLFCAIILFVFGLIDLQKETELSIVEFPENLIRFLYNYVSNQRVVIFSGFVSSVIALIISGKHSLQMTNIFSQILWIAMILSESPLIIILIDKIDLILLRPILSLFVVLFSLINICLNLISFVFNTKSQRKQNSNEIKEKNKNSTNNQKSVYLTEKYKSFNETDIKDNKSSDQSIGEQIKCLSILDETESTVNCRPNQYYFKTKNNISSDNCFNSSLNFERSSVRSVVLPAKFHYESVAQTSWVSPFKPNISPRKDKHISSLYSKSSQSFDRTSQWVNHHMSGLVTPPPSATTSLCSDSPLINRFSSMDGTNCLYPIFESHSNDRHTNHHKRRLNRKDLISENSYEDTIDGRSAVTQETTKYEKEDKQTIFIKSIQSLIIGIFVLILFCFVIFLSLPVVIKTSCDLHSMDCQFSVEKLTQNNVFY